MNKPQNTNVQYLRAEILRLYSIHRECMSRRQVSLANECFTAALSVLRQLRISSGSEYPSVLNEMLQDSPDDVRVLIAVEGLWEIPQTAERVLQDIGQCSGLNATTARWSLREWKEGKLGRPTE
jgi:hypothetical protein